MHMNITDVHMTDTHVLVIDMYMQTSTPDSEAKLHTTWRAFHIPMANLPYVLMLMCALLHAVMLVTVL